MGGKETSPSIPRICINVLVRCCYVSKGGADGAWAAETMLNALQCDVVLKAKNY